MNSHISLYLSSFGWYDSVDAKSTGLVWVLRFRSDNSLGDTTLLMPKAQVLSGGFVSDLTIVWTLIFPTGEEVLEPKLLMT